MAKFHKKYPKMDNRELLKLMMNKYVGLPDEEKVWSERGHCENSVSSHSVLLKASNFK